jgi:hypothetical protein
MSAHENLEHVEHVEHASHGGNKKIALLISILALFLALSEMGGKSAQTEAVTENVRANDLWAFFQAKTIRITVLTTAAEQMQIELERATDPAVRDRINRRITEWKSNIARYDDDAKSDEGRKQLMQRAKEAEHKRDELLGRYHNFEMASAAFQIGIVLASAEVITAMAVLGWLAGVAGIAGLGLAALGTWFPHVHLL